MTIDEDLLREAVARIRKSVGAQLAAAQSPARVALLLLQDSLDRLLYMFAGDAPITKQRAWGGDDKAVDVGALLHGASQELAKALGDASVCVDDDLRATIEKLVEDLTVFVARVLDVSRGAEHDLAASPAPVARLARSPVPGSAPTAEQVTRTAAFAIAEERETPKPELVSFSASAPIQVRPGDEFVARLAAYLPEDEARVRAALAQTAPGARLSAVPKQGGLLRGTEVEIVLEGAGLTIDGGSGRAAQRFVWEGSSQIVEFDVQVPPAVAPDEAPRNVVLKFYVRLAGVVLERVLLELETGATQAARTTERREVPGTQLPTTAFASYSSLDRPRVLDRVAAIRIATGIDVFLDCMDLNPSEKWEPRLRDEIDTRNLFILFWSKAAAQSRWVTWEWECALAAKGPDALQIQPLENGVPPPRALRAVHLADPYVDLRWAELERRSPGH